MRLVCAVQILFALASPFTGAIFTATEHGYQRGRAVPPISQLVPLYCYLLFTRHGHPLPGKAWPGGEVVFFLLYIFVPLVAA